MSRPEAEPEPEAESESESESEALSAGASATLALGAPWRGRMVCSGCGQRPVHMAPLDAVAVIRVLARRGALLLHHHEDSLGHRRREPGSWSAMEPAAKASAVLGATNDRLRELLGEETAEPVPIAMEGAGLAPDGQRQALDSLGDNVRSLVATIEGATTQDWHRVCPDTDATAADMVWLALHDARHHLEDAELVLDAALAGGPSSWTTGDDHLPEVHFRRA
jgi:hypothetical protein